MVRNMEPHLLPAGHRKWIGNDAKGRHHQNKVSRTETQLYMHLSWKAGSDAPVQFVGCYELDMVQLLAQGYLRADGPDAVRLRFFHADDGNIYIQSRLDAPRLRVGSVAAS